MAVKEKDAVVALAPAKEKQGTRLPAQLLSISEKVFNLDNEKETPYRVCTVKLDGDTAEYSAMLWETSVTKGIELGSCKVEARVENNKVYLTVLGNGANRITLEGLMALTGKSVADLEGAIL